MKLLNFTFGLVLLSFIMTSQAEALTVNGVWVNGYIGKITIRIDPHTPRSRVWNQAWTQCRVKYGARLKSVKYLSGVTFNDWDRDEHWACSSSSRP